MDLFYKDNPLMDINEIIARNLSAWMNGHKTLFTLKKVSAKSGVGFGTVQRIKNGEGNITAKNVALIATAFGRKPAELMAPPEEMQRDITYELSDGVASNRLHVAEPIALQIKTDREKLSSSIADLLPKMSEYGLVAVLEKAKEAARDYPLIKETPSSSA